MGEFIKKQEVLNILKIEFSDPTKNLEILKNSLIEKIQNTDTFYLDEPEDKKIYLKVDKQSKFLYCTDCGGTLGSLRVATTQSLEAIPWRYCRECGIKFSGAILEDNGKESIIDWNE